MTPMILRKNRCSFFLYFLRYRWAATESQGVEDRGKGVYMTGV